MIEFDRLLTLADDVTLSCISTAEGVRSHLSARPEVMALRQALVSGAVTFEDVEAFVRGLIAQFVRGTHSPADAVLAAIVVAAELLPRASIEQFIENLARVTIAEMPMSPRVARLSLHERRKQLAQVTVRELDINNLLPQLDGPSEDHPCRIEVGVDYRTLDLLKVA